MLETEYKTYYKRAASIPNWQKMNKNDLINLYIDHENEPIGEAYFSAIVLRYWGNIGKYYLASKSSGFSIEDCYSWLIEAILYALEKRKWRDPNNSLSKDKNAPDKVVNRCIFSKRKENYYRSNRAVRKGNYAKVSYDQLNEDVGEDRNSFFVSDSNDINKTTYSYDMVMLIQNLMKKNKVLEGLVLNCLLSDDPYKHNLQTDRWKVNVEKVSNALLSYKSLNIGNKLSLDTSTFDKVDGVLRDIKSLNKLRLNKCVNQALSNLKRNKDLEEILCY